MGQITSMCDGPRQEVTETPKETPKKDKKKKKKSKKKKKTEEEDTSGLSKYEKAAEAARKAVTELQEFGEVAHQSRKALQASFEALDEDNSGELTIDELDPFLRGVYEPTEDEIKEFLQKFDHDGDGEITFPEFQVGMKRLFPGEYEGKEGVAKLKEYFKKYDSDDSGMIQDAELLQVARDLMQINPGMKKKTLMLFDVNMDGKISFDEFMDVIVKLKGDLSQIWTTHRKTAAKKDKSDKVRAWKVKKESR